MLLTELLQLHSLTYGDPKRWLHSSGGDWTHDALDKLLNILSNPFKPPLLDLGCGNGRWSSYYPEGWVGLDIGNVPKGCVRGIAQHLPFISDLFQTVIAVTIVQHVPFQEKDVVYGEVKRVLRPGGLFLIIEGDADIGNDYLWNMRWQKQAEALALYFKVFGVINLDSEYVGLLMKKK